MVNLNKMYDGVVNSPETYLTQNLAADATIIYVADSSAFGSLPNLAVIGTDQNAETILIKSKRSDGGLEVQRALEGPAKRWEKTTEIARNFTNFDYQQIKDNIEKLNKNKQETLTAGNNIQIVNGKISATDSKYDDTQIKKDIVELQNSQLKKASQTEAESGVDNTKYMTPQATKQAIEKLSPKQDLSEYLKTTDLKNAKLRTNKNSIRVFTDRSKSETDLDIILGDLELRTEQNKKNIKTKLSEMTEDSTHRTVTDSEKEKWNKKFDLPAGKENQVLTKTTNGAEFKEISSSRSATFVIANYDSSENSKAGADYVIQESDCAAEIINSFIGKLPNYGGKIQLTEGNFNIKKPISINFTKNNTIIEGYGDSTNIIDKLTKDARNSVIVNISNGIANCRLSDLNITHEASNSINIRGNKNYFKNLNVINNGSYPSVYFGDNTRENMFENCNIKCNASYSYWIPSTSESNTLLCCSAESTESNANPFCIEGKNNIISNCYGKTIGAYVFNISGESNQFSNCAAVSNITAFQIQGSKNQLSNCRGVANKYDGIGTDKTAKDILITNCIGISQSGDGVSIGGNNIHVSNTFGISNNGDGITTSPGSQRCIIVNCVAKTSNKSEKGMLALGDTHVFMGNIIYGKDNIYSSSVRLKQNNITF